MTMVLFLAASTVQAEFLRQSQSSRVTGFEFLLKKCNPSDFNYGAWLERRRRVFLEATVKEPHFWYSSSVTAVLLFVTAAYAKLSLDHRRTMRITEEMMADLFTHDLYSREAAKEAIGRYNQHMEHCNRAIETSEGGDSRPGWGDGQLDSLKKELQLLASQLEAIIQERNKLQEELRQKSVIIADLSTRLDALSKKADGPRDTGTSTRHTLSANTNGDGARFVSQINRLQEELYAERQKNKRCKGT